MDSNPQRPQDTNVKGSLNTSEWEMSNSRKPVACEIEKNTGPGVNTPPEETKDYIGRELDKWDRIMQDPDKLAEMLEYDDMEDLTIDYYLQDQGSWESSESDQETMQRTEHTAYYDKYWQPAKIQRTDTWSQVVDNYENTYLDQKEWPIEVQVMKRVT